MLVLVYPFAFCLNNNNNMLYLMMRYILVPRYIRLESVLRCCLARHVLRIPRRRHPQDTPRQNPYQGTVWHVHHVNPHMINPHTII
ncbi:unnamed protein product [Musa acuminata subsp. malaccensis]|uniref:(wild Malaysian banana) hypothetical protein n=1 Tax=Musa acuminata subsp. malaccensis TaxID=214687 RepID=A0A804IEE8_MUSAM|nr:unnamed protein product [Musa acuminata subsp. malaccensis]